MRNTEKYALCTGRELICICVRVSVVSVFFCYFSHEQQVYERYIKTKLCAQTENLHFRTKERVCTHCGKYMEEGTVTVTLSVES
jgi:hypothetical protein